MSDTDTVRRSWRSRFGFDTPGFDVTKRAIFLGMLTLLLQMEDYTLLSGTLALFAALFLAMFATRNVDWYRVGRAPGRQQA